MDYVRFTAKRNKDNVYFCKMDQLTTTYYKLHQRIPEAFEDKYFRKKEHKDLLELGEILNN